LLQRPGKDQVDVDACRPVPVLLDRQLDRLLGPGPSALVGQVQVEDQLGRILYAPMPLARV
jgi:hypothetical protein